MRNKLNLTYNGQAHLSSVKAEIKEREGREWKYTIVRKVIHGQEVDVKVYEPVSSPQGAQEVAESASSFPWNN